MNTKTALCCLAIAFASWTQSRPDFSGVWKLNIDETEFPAGKPASGTFSAVRTVEQIQDRLRLKVEREVNRQKSGFNFVTIRIGSSEPHVSDEAGIITARWQGESLHFDYLYNPGTERQSERTEDWTLSSDGKKLIDQEWVKQPDGHERRYKLVFDRQANSIR